MACRDCDNCCRDRTCPDLVTGEECSKLQEFNEQEIKGSLCDLPFLEMCKLPEWLTEYFMRIYCLFTGVIDRLCRLEERVKCLIDFIFQDSSFDRWQDTYVRTSAYNDGSSFYRDVMEGYTIDLYMDSTQGNDGTTDDGKRKVADQDYMVTLHACLDGTSLEEGQTITTVTVFRSTENFSDAMKIERARHYETSGSEMAVPMSDSIRIRQGEFLKVRVEGETGSGQFRLHQIHLIWQPISNINATKPDCLN